MQSFAACKKHAFSILAAGLLVAAGTSLASPPADYYDTITGQTGSDLKLELRAIISGQRGYPVSALSYDGARDALLNSVDNVGGGQVRMLYTNDLRPVSQWAISVNREHTWPQSYGASSSPQKSDMHHLFLCDDGINSTRGNDLYGYVTGGTNATNFTGLPGDQNKYLNSVWEVSPNHRGDVARAILYMDTRYSAFSLINRGDTLGTNKMGYLDDLIQWNAEDPVDAFEQQRNDRVFTFQNNRNPYIDNNTWVDLVYGNSTATGPSLSNLNRTPSVPDEFDTVSVSVDATDGDGVSIVQLNWRVGTSGGFTTIPMTLSSGSTYTTTTSIPAQAGDTIVQYYVRSTDTLSNESFAPASGAVGPASYTVSGNNPVLNNLTTNPSTVTASNTVHIQVVATDDDGNTGANLTLSTHWRVGSGSFTTIPMSVFSGTTWQTNTPIPAQPVDTTVEYYVTAVDLSAASSTIPNTAPATPAAYFVEAALPYNPITNAAQVVGKLVLTEVSAITNASAFTEFVELANVSDEGFLLNALMLQDNGVGTPAAGESYLKFPVGTTIDPGGIIVIFNRDNPDQTFVDTIPVISNRNSSPVQVFALDNTLTFNGTPVVAMTAGDATEPQLNNSGDNVELVYIDAADGDGSEEQYQLDDVVDGVGYGTIATSNTKVGWGPAVQTSTNAFNVPLSGSDGIYRLAPTDTDAAADWIDYGGAGPYTPGLLPAAFEIPEPLVIVSGTSFNIGTDELTINEGSSEDITLSLASDPGQTVSVSVINTGGSDRAADFIITAGATLTFNSGNFSDPQTVSVQKNIDANITSDNAAFEIVGSNVQTHLFSAIEVENTVVGDWELMGY